MAMRARTEKLINVEPEDLEDRVAEFEADGSKSVVATRQPDGRWTIVAIVPVEDGK